MFDFPFHFIRPYWLWLLIPLSFTLWYFLKRQAQGQWDRACDAHLLPNLLNAPSLKTRYHAITLALCALLTTLALAGPSLSQQAQPVLRSLDARVMILNLSPSMNSTDVAPSRLTRAKHKLRDALTMSGEGQTGLIVYSGGAYVVSPLTQDADTINAMVPVLESNLMPAPMPQGENLHLALEKAADIMRQGNATQGDILLITDFAADQRALQAAEKIKNAGYRLSVLGVGTQEGAPIPLPDGGFFNDRAGNILLSQLNANKLRALARTGGGRYADLRADNRDLEQLIKPNTAQALAETDTETFLWRDQGRYLLLLLLPIALLAFRRGALLSVCLICFFSPSLYAMTWQDLWQRPDQQGMRSLEKGDAAQAADRFHDPNWQGAAHYRAEQYEEALEAFNQSDDIEALYNQGNTLAQLGEFEQALAAYEQVLALDPHHLDAQWNHEVIEDLLEDQPPPDSDSESDSSDAAPDENQDTDADPDNDGSSDNEQGEGDESPQDSPPSEGDDPGDSDQDNSDGNEGDEEAPPETSPEQDSQNADTSGDDDSQADASPDTNEMEQPADIDPQAAWDGDPELSPEEQQALEQWLRQVPDDPGGLLRRKFQRQYEQSL